MHGVFFLQFLHSVQKRLIGRSTLDAVALMGALAVIRLQIAVPISLELLDTLSLNGGKPWTLGVFFALSLIALVGFAISHLWEYILKRIERNVNTAIQKSISERTKYLDTIHAGELGKIAKRLEALEISNKMHS